MTTTSDLFCDCHMHVYDMQRYPLPQADPVSPPHATWSDYLAVRARLRLARAVIVQAAGYAFDNRCTLHALAQDPHNTRAILTLPTNITEADLAQYDAQGVRGVRFMLLPGTPCVMRWKDLPIMAARIAPLDWNVNLQLDGRELAQVESMLAHLPCRLVIDHVGKFLEPVATDHPGFLALRRLLDGGNTWVKLSAPYETSRTGKPAFEDVGRLARTLAHAYPQRCLWASNWPHPTQRDRPDERKLLTLLTQWARTPEDVRQILHDNPGELYRFSG